MIFKEFGEKGKPVILLIHGFCMSWKMWNEQIKSFKEDYYVIVPVLDGHDTENKSTFMSIEDASNKIIEFLISNQYDVVFAICGISLGGSIALDIISKQRIHVGKAIIDAGVAPLKMNKVAKNMIIYISAFQIWSFGKNKKMIETMFKPSMYFQNNVDEFYQVCKQMTFQTSIKVYRSLMYFELPENLANIETKIVYWYGTKEAKQNKINADYVTAAFPFSKSQTFEGYNHGQLCIGNPSLYIENAYNFFNEV